MAGVVLDFEQCYRAVDSRDARFDGWFVTAVTSTGIYCRPSCPALTPRRENVRFLPSAAAAQRAGFRACLRCRPETAPDMGAWRGTSNTVSRALALIVWPPFAPLPPPFSRLILPASDSGDVR